VGQYGASSETNSFVIIGLLSLGVNPEGITTLNDNSTVNFGKSKGDLVSALLSFKVAAGNYSHILEGESNSLSTEQCLRALISINEYKKSGKAYNYYDSKINAESLKLYTEVIPNENADNNPVSPANNTNVSQAITKPVTAAPAKENSNNLKQADKKATSTNSKYSINLSIGGILIAIGILGVGFQVLNRKEN